jgi:hypothetical protein
MTTPQSDLLAVLALETVRHWNFPALTAALDALSALNIDA